MRYANPKFSEKREAWVLFASVLGRDFFKIKYNRRGCVAQLEPGDRMCTIQMKPGPV